MEEEYGLAQFKLRIGEATLDAQVALPKCVVKTTTLLPIFQGLTDTVVGATVRSLNEEGVEISCKAGCGACCRQIVPISEHEARRIAEVVEAMPEERQAQVRQRFHNAMTAFRDLGLLERMMRMGQMEDRKERVDLGLEYFHAGVPCPFLENESCGIYEDRPLRCREYLVTSPPENCASPEPETVKGVPMPLIPSKALYNFGPGDGRQRRVVIPLIAALDWVERAGEEELPRKEANEVLFQFLRDLQK